MKILLKVIYFIFVCQQYKYRYRKKYITEIDLMSFEQCAITFLVVDLQQKCTIWLNDYWLDICYVF